MPQIYEFDPGHADLAAGKHESGIVLSAGVMLASFLGSIGLFLGACVWGELRAWRERRP